MTNSNQPNINKTDLALTPDILNPEIADAIIQAFVRNMAWDGNNNLWRKLLADVDGRLLVSTSPTQGSSAVQSQSTLPAVTTQILGINTSRRLMIIQNLGATAIYLGFGIPALVATGLQVASGGSFIDDHFLGAVNAISTSGTNDVRITEM